MVFARVAILIVVSLAMRMSQAVVPALQLRDSHQLNHNVTFQELM